MSIIFENVSYAYAPQTPFETQALKNINWKIEKGDMWLVVGNTGSGKSTLIQLINGILLPTQGRVIVEGIDTKNKKEKINEIRKKVGIVFQYPEDQFFLPTVQEELNFAIKNFNLNINPINALKTVGLNEKFLNRNPFNLSGGEKRKVAIASVISYNPDYIIFDEPTVGLDFLTRKTIWKVIKNLLNEGKTIILITHWYDDMIIFQPKVLMLFEGEIVFKGNFEEFVLLDEKFLKEKGIILSEKMKLYKCLLLKNEKEKIKELFFNI